jgi:hypothetical protein
MADKTLRELYFDVLAAIYDTTEIELTEVELGKENDIQFNYRERDYYWLYVDEKDTKTAELCTHYPAEFKDNDEELKAIRLFNQINKKFKMVKMYHDEETGDITARVDLFVNGIQPAGNSFLFNDKERFVENLLLALSALWEVTEYFFDEMATGIARR